MNLEGYLAHILADYNDFSGYTTQLKSVVYENQGFVTIWSLKSAKIRLGNGEIFHLFLFSKKKKT